MKIYKLHGLIFFCCLLFIECSSDSPEKYFNIAVLNTNMFSGFAGNGMYRQLESPSVKLSENSGETVAMKQSEIMKAKIENTEENFKKLKDLKETEDTKDMLESSMALYEFVLPVYKTEYSQLAGLFDEGAPKNQIELLAQSIHDKYYAKYTELYNKLIGIGKSYAQRHDIKVNWGGY